MNCKDERFQSALALTMRLLLGVIFLSSGWQKLGNLDLFYQTAQGYKILTPALTQIYAGALPWLETLAGLLLVLGLFTRFAAILTSSLLLSFLVAVTWVLLRGDTVECGCFLGGGEQSSPVTWALWFRDVAMLAVAGFLVWQPGKRWHLDSLISDKPLLKKGLLIFLALYGFVAGMIAISSKVPEPPPPPPERPPLLDLNTTAPDFRLGDLDGNIVALQDYRNKKWVLLEIFATWCPHCQHSVPMLKQLQQTESKQLQILAINAGDQPGMVSSAPIFQQEFQTTYPILDHPPETLLKAYHVSGFPTLYLVNPAGKIVWRHVGTLSLAQVKDIRKLMGR